MTKHEILTKAISLIRPQSEWVLRGNTYEDLEWLDRKQAKPSQEEIWIALTRIQNNLYKEKRKEDYPPIGDQLDIIWKFVEVLQTSGLFTHPDAAEMLKKIQSVKRKHPKPNV